MVLLAPINHNNVKPGWGGFAAFVIFGEKTKRFFYYSSFDFLIQTLKQ